MPSGYLRQTRRGDGWYLVPGNEVRAFDIDEHEMFSKYGVDEVGEWKPVYELYCMQFDDNYGQYYIGNIRNKEFSINEIRKSN